MSFYSLINSDLINLSKAYTDKISSLPRTDGAGTLNIRDVVTVFVRLGLDISKDYKYLEYRKKLEKYLVEQ